MSWNEPEPTTGGAGAVTPTKCFLIKRQKI